MNTMQQEFDTVVEHLYNQGKPAKKDKFCVYRSAEGLTCAVGCRIPDTAYDPAMDVPNDTLGTSVDSLIRNFSASLPVEIIAYEKMFSRLQHTHDSDYNLCGENFDFAKLEEDLTGIAEDFGLTFTVPSK